MFKTLFNRIRRHMTNSQSHHHRIASSFLLVSFFVMIGKLAGAAKEMALAWRYGISETVDAYVFVFTLILLPVSIWLSILTVVLVPLLTRLRNGNSQETPRFMSELTGLTLILGIVFSALLYFIFPSILDTGWTGLSESTLKLAINFTTGLAPVALFGVMTSLYSAYLLANSQHRNTLFEAIPALVILIALLLPTTWITEPLILGTLVGVFFQLIALSIPLKQRSELHVPSFNFDSPAWKGFWNAIGILAVSQTLMAFINVIDQFTAASLGAGAISTLSYSNRILALLIGLGATAISRAILPVFSDIQSTGIANIRKIAFQWSTGMFLLGTGVFVITWWLSPWVVEILFERGEFTAVDTQRVSEVLRWGLIQVPFYFAGLVMVQLLASQQRYKVIAFFALTNLLVKVIFNWVLAKWMGVSGIALATAVMHVWSTACLFIVLYRWVPSTSK